MKNKTALLPLLIIGFVAVLGCSKLTQLANNAANTAKTDDSRVFSLTGKEWSSYDLENTDIKVELPGKPKDESPPLPAAYKPFFSAMHIFSYDEKGFASSYTELVPTGKKKVEIKFMADTAMTALKRQIPDLKYTADIKSDSKAVYSGTFTRNGKAYDLRGCCLIRKNDPLCVWAILTLIPKDNADAATAAERIIGSVSFRGSDEVCK